MKRKMVLLLTGMMVMASLYGCGGNGAGDSGSDTDSAEQTETEDDSEAGGGVTLTLYCNADDMAKPYMQKIISMWEEESGNKIDQQGLDTDNAETIALTKFTTGDIPDLYVHFGNSNLKNFNPEENFCGLDRRGMGIGYPGFRSAPGCVQ